ncbi:MAG: hypothetical protein F4Y42_20920 [Caldilineaceae bacterium SB0664_bin_27]|uniref:Uncharacterized protein n=1 Tax=Caldilineaceae bacterium SB0664_bin_27 TaxID=2605260 RepID=A0A6B0Z0W9_9CHLR|nr:hypothetical protein [Caldilineaceae bacterium SB0664_bin_27]
MRLAAFTDSGYFWLPSDKDRSRQVPGTLAVSEAGIVTLETFGYPSRDPLSLARGSFDQAGSNLTRVFGYTRERGAVTLVDGICTQSGRQSATSGVSFASFALLAETLLAGGHFDEEEPLFDRLVCRIEGLHEWLGVSGITTEPDFDNHRTSITYQRPDPLPFRAGDDVKGQFGFEYSIPGSAPWATEARVSQSACIQLSTSASWTTEDVINWAMRMRDFLSLGTDAPVALTSLDGYLQGGAQEAAAQGNREHPVRIFFQSAQHSPESATVRPWSMSFAYRDLGNGLSNALTNWFDLCRKWPQPVGLFFDARYGDGVLPEDLRFIKVEEALQKLAPVMGIEECAGSRERIRRLASKFSELLGIGEGGEREFAKRVRDTRNWCVHRSPPTPKHQPCVGIDLIRLLRQCEALLFYCFVARVLGSETAAKDVLRDARPIKTRLG